MKEQIETLEATPAQETEPEKATPKKRTTITSLKADLKALESFMDEEIIPAIELTEDRVNKIIERTKQTPIVETPMLEARLQTLEEDASKHNDTLMSDFKIRLDVLDKSTEIIHGNQAALMTVHLQMQEDLNVIANNNNQMQDAIIALQEEETAEAPEPHLMADVIPTEATRTTGIADLANVCVSMSDVLMICRYLKADPEIPEEVRIETLQLACRRAGVPVSAGMNARAGVKYVVA
jgi:hypothetical protein